MALLKACDTITEVYRFLTEEYGKTVDKDLLRYKVDDKYTGVSYSKFKEETDSFAFGLTSLGIKREDKVAIMAENRPEWVYTDMAALALGGVDVPLYPSLTAASVEFILFRILCLRQSATPSYHGMNDEYTGFLPCAAYPASLSISSLYLGTQWLSNHPFPGQFPEGSATTQVLG